MIKYLIATPLGNLVETATESENNNKYQMQFFVNLGWAFLALTIFINIYILQYYNIYIILISSYFV